jgi:hypothetical protein
MFIIGSVLFGIGASKIKECDLECREGLNMLVASNSILLVAGFIMSIWRGL